MSDGSLYPLGGDESTSGYKGYGLIMMIEILCGILAGSHWGPNIRNMLKESKVSDLGQCFIAINTKSFAPGFPARMHELLNGARNLEPIDPNKPVLVPGDAEKNNVKRVLQQNGILYQCNMLDEMKSLSEKLNVKPIEIISSCLK